MSDYSKKPVLRWGIIGGGLMGREFASALGRWFALTDETLPRAELVAVCDLVETTRNWFERVPTVKQITADADELLANPDVDAVYVALPHNLHQEFYLKVLRAGKDLLAEKPFGIDLQAAQIIRDEAEKLNRFVRCSSELPFLPGGQRVHCRHRRRQRDSLELLGHAHRPDRYAAGAKVVADDLRGSGDERVSADHGDGPGVRDTRDRDSGRGLERIRDVPRPHRAVAVRGQQRAANHRTRAQAAHVHQPAAWEREGERLQQRGARDGR